MTGRINTFTHMHTFTRYRKLLPISRQETNTESGIDKKDFRRIRKILWSRIHIFYPSRYSLSPLCSYFGNVNRTKQVGGGVDGWWGTTIVKKILFNRWSSCDVHRESQLKSLSVITYVCGLPATQGLEVLRHRRDLYRSSIQNECVNIPRRLKAFDHS